VAGGKAAARLPHSKKRGSSRLGSTGTQKARKTRHYKIDGGQQKKGAGWKPACGGQAGATTFVPMRPSRPNLACGGQAGWWLAGVAAKMTVGVTMEL
jgi:uncharacterized protein YfaQ (DUF2300 family)